jgi:hypothetical protein
MNGLVWKLRTLSILVISLLPLIAYVMIRLDFGFDVTIEILKNVVCSLLSLEVYLAVRSCRHSSRCVNDLIECETISPHYWLWIFPSDSIDYILLQCDTSYVLLNRLV